MKKTTGNEKYECLRLENQICFPLYACAKEIVRQYRKPLKALDLTYTQYIVMMALWEFGGMSESELGRKVKLDSGTLAPLLKRLENQGLVNRQRPKENERMLLITLTDEGEELRKKAVEVPEAVRGCIKLTDKELIQLKSLLEKALASLEGGC